MTAAPDPQATEAERAASRAASLLARAGAWLEPDGADYVVRAAADRRRRPSMRLDEAGFAALAAAPGLRPRPQGGWLLRAPLARQTRAPPAGRPGVVPGVRAVTEEGGRVATRAANLGESPLAWLARRRDPRGEAWLGAAELAAAERLRADVEAAGLIGRLTMRWDGQPRGGGGVRVDPAERARAAKARVAAALEAVGPGLREMLERVCLVGSALEAVERELELPRRAGKTVLKLGLQRLAAHYRIG